jgi:hypothetical protein
MKPMADFCGVDRQTVKRWMSYDQDCPLPRGETLFKFMCYLDLHGYKVIEFERMPKVLRNFAELLGYGVVTADQAPELTGYGDKSQVYQVLNERDGISKEKETRMFEIWKEKRNELELKKRQAFEISRLEILFKSTTQEERPRQQVLALPEPAKSFSSRYSAMLLIMEGLLMSFEEGIFNNLSADDLVTLNSRSRGSILRLSAHLSNLSSRLMTTERESNG